MYRKYKSNNEGVAKATNDAITRSLSNLTFINPAQPSVVRPQQPTVVQSQPPKHAGDSREVQAAPEDPEIAACVETCWQEIDRQCLLGNRSSGTPEPSQGWQTVRIFVSSTFTDFFCEREILVKKVFPELREWCAERKLYLVECDLRWGVPRHSTTTDTVFACMEELDRCIASSGGNPFFLNMVGEKYGWIPAEKDLSEELKTRYCWVPNTSITFMEVLHGAYRMQNPNAAIFFRTPDVLKDIPQDHKARFQDPDRLGRKQLQVLKQRLRERFPAQVKDYHCSVDGVVELHGRETIKIVGLEEFADQTLQFFKLAIERTFPQRHSVEALSELQEEHELQKTMMEDHASVGTRRQDAAEILMSYIHGNTEVLKLGEAKKPFSRDAKFWTSELTGNMLLCVSGPAGYGKTTLLASVAQEAAKEDVSVFYHFCGGTGSSHKATLLLQRLLLFLHPDISVETLESLKDKSVEELREVLKMYLLHRETNPTHHRILLVLDGLDQLSSNEFVSHLNWLPPLFPGNMLCLVSTSQHPPTVSRVQEHPHYWLELGPLSHDTAQQIVTASLAHYSKKLDKEQLSLILNSKCAKSPLWLYLICEELRVYGDFRSLTQKAEAIVESVEKLLEAIFQRLIQEDETECMKKTLCLIASANGVLTALDVQRMLGDIDDREPVSSIIWAKIRRNLKAYLRISGYNEQILFRHNLIRTVVNQLLIRDRESLVEWNTVLADYIELWSDNPRMKAEDLPHHLLQANLKTRLVSFLRKGPDSAGIPTFMRSKYHMRCRCSRLSDPVIQKTNPVQICQFCHLSRAAFHPKAFHSNKDMCVVCGNFVFANMPNTPNAYLCVFHSPMHGRGPKHCFVCDKIIPLNGGHPGKLCQHCGFGNYGKQCAALDIRW